MFHLVPCVNMYYDTLIKVEVTNSTTFKRSFTYLFCLKCFSYHSKSDHYAKLIAKTCCFTKNYFKLFWERTFSY